MGKETIVEQDYKYSGMVGLGERHAWEFMLEAAETGETR